MTINNMAQMYNSYRYLSINNAQAAKSLQRLSSGYRINSAADDAAGLAISERMRGQIRGLSKAEENSTAALSLVQTAESGIGQSVDAMQRMRELALQARNGTLDDSQRAMLNEEFQALKSHINQVASSQNYNGQKLLNGTMGGVQGEKGVRDMGVSGITATNVKETGQGANFTIERLDGGDYSITAQVGDEFVTQTVAAGDTSATFAFKSGTEITMDFSGNASGTAAGLKEGVIGDVGLKTAGSNVSYANAVSKQGTGEMTFQIGANSGADQRMGIQIGDMSSFALGIDDLDISSADGANNAIAALDKGIATALGERSKLGATYNRFEHTVNNLSNSRLNLTEAESKIRDVDMAFEMMRFMQQSLMAQSSQAMLSQSMMSRQNILSLLLR